MLCALADRQKLSLSSEERKVGPWLDESQLRLFCSVWALLLMSRALSVLIECHLIVCEYDDKLGV